MKNRILSQNAKQLGKQLQYIEKECWSCDDGVFRGYDDGMRWIAVEPKTCYKCSGTGIYDKVYSVLVLWQFGKYQFHHFVDRIAGPLELESYFRDLPTLDQINGKVKHKRPKYWYCNEALLWLFLLYDRKAFLKKIRSSTPYTNFYTPMNILNKLVFEFRNGKVARRRLKYRLRSLKTFFFPQPKPNFQTGNNDDLPF